MNPLEVTQIGPYAVRRFIEEGGMAWVFEVADPMFETRRLALKMLKPEAAVGEEFERFRDEAKLLAAMNHPNLVTIYTFGKDDATGCHYYTMEFIDGPSLSERIRNDGPLSAAEAHRIFHAVLDGLAQLHEHEERIVHRDIKPANILIDRTGRPRLADLGIARQQRSTGRTRTGVAIGTVAYMSPEQMRGQPVDARSDVFSMGLTLYESLTGQALYDGVEGLDSTSEYELIGYVYARSTSGEEIPISFPAGSDVPEPLRAVITKALAIYAEDRYADAAAMRTALDEAMRPAPQVVAGESARWPLYVAAAAVGLLLVAGVAWWIDGIFERRALAAAVGADAESLTQLQSAGETHLERVKDLQPAPPGALIERAEDVLEDAKNDLEDCRQFLQAEQLMHAQGFCARARRHFEEACGELGRKDVSLRTQSRVDRAGERVASLREGEAPVHRPQEFAALEARLAEVGTAPSGGAPCTLLGAELDRLDGAEQTLAEADVMERQLADLWPRLAERARNEALGARDLLRAVVEVPVYTAEVAAASGALAEGEQLESAADYLAARDQYVIAGERFAEAKRIEPAAAARGELRTFEQENPITSVSVARMIARADDLFGRRDWEKASEEYRLALSEAKKELGIRQSRDVVRADLESAQAARASAVAEGAEASAVGRFGRADAAFAAGQQAFDAGDPARLDEAAQKLREARTLFEESRDEAVRVLADARTALDGARRRLGELVGDGSCAGLFSSSAQKGCDTAAADLARADQALAERDGLTASRIVQTALAGLQQAQEQESLAQANRPRPPRIVSHTPKRERVEVYRNKSVSASVEASDPNGDRLTYAWSFDGRRLDARGPSVELQPDASGRLEVVVSDADSEVSNAWDVVVKNRKPELALQPSGETVQLAIGDTRNFEALVSDPDGDRVETVFQLDGRSVGSGERYTFRASSSGTFQLAVAATDSGGARTVVSRRIVVGAAPPPKQTKEVAPPTPPTTDPLRAKVLDTLERYRNCINAKDMRCLQRVWLLSEDSPYFAYWSSKFRGSEAFEVSVSLVSYTARGDGQGVDVRFRQIESSSNRQRVRDYEAVLLERTSTGEWQIIENSIDRG